MTSSTTTPSQPKQPSSPREFFRKLYGDLEQKSSTQDETKNSIIVKKSETELVTPIPILASSLPFLLPHASDSQLAVAAAGLSAFCKLYFINFHWNIFVQWS